MSYDIVLYLVLLLVGCRLVRAATGEESRRTIFVLCNVCSEQQKVYNINFTKGPR